MSPIAELELSLRVARPTRNAGVFRPVRAARRMEAIALRYSAV